MDKALPATSVLSVQRIKQFISKQKKARQLAG